MLSAMASRASCRAPRPHADAGWEIAGFVSNFTDEIVFVSGIDFDNLTGMINEPRTRGLEVRASF